MIHNYNNPHDKRVYPERWQVKRGKSLFKVKDKRSVNGTEELLTVSHLTGITPRKQKNVTMFKAESLVGYKKCSPGDIAANTMWTWQGAIGVSKYDGVVSPSYNVYSICSDVYDLDYLDYLLREKKMVAIYHSLSTGVRPSRLRLYPDAFLSLYFPVPSIAEQKKIVSFLGWRASSVNKTITNIKKQIMLINEEKQTITDRLITTGVAGVSNRDFKQIGISSIGRIPTDWVVCEIRNVAKLYTGNSISDSEKSNYEEVTDTPYISTKDVNLITSKVNYENGLYVPDDSKFRICPPNASLLCIEGGSAGKKRAFINKEIAFVNKLCAFVPNGINAKYLYYYLCSNAFVEQFTRSITGLIGGVSVNALKQLKIIIPSESEQQSIVEYLDNKYYELNMVIDNLLHEIDLLQEYRANIISDTINGEIDVRKINIPDYKSVDVGIGELETDEEEDLTE